ncbi:hypothetical protein HDU97_008493 [Phlyctochytrium planicorne]|nr:hypothetical protein HDU97_008493 [Phlyctochytrium planicorne]
MILYRLSSIAFLTSQQGNVRFLIALSKVYCSMQLHDKEMETLFRVLQSAHENLTLIPSKTLPRGVCINLVLLRLSELMEQLQLKSLEELRFKILRTFIFEWPDKSDSELFRKVSQRYCAIYCQLGRLEESRQLCYSLLNERRGDLIPTLVLGRCVLYDRPKLRKRLNEGIEHEFELQEVLSDLENANQLLENSIPEQVSKSLDYFQYSVKRRKLENSGTLRLNTEILKSASIDLVLFSNEEPWKAAKALTFEKIEILTSLATIHQQQGNLVQAAKFCEEAYLLAPEWRYVFQHLYNTSLARKSSRSKQKMAFFSASVYICGET